MKIAAKKHKEGVSHKETQKDVSREEREETRRIFVFLPRGEKTLNSHPVINVRNTGNGVPNVEISVRNSGTGVLNTDIGVPDSGIGV